MASLEFRALLREGFIECGALARERGVEFFDGRRALMLDSRRQRADQRAGTGARGQRKSCSPIYVFALLIHGCGTSGVTVTPGIPIILLRMGGRNHGGSGSGGAGKRNHAGGASGALTVACACCARAPGLQLAVSRSASAAMNAGGAVCLATTQIVLPPVIAVAHHRNLECPKGARC